MVALWHLEMLYERVAQSSQATMACKHVHFKHSSTWTGLHSSQEKAAEYAIPMRIIVSAQHGDRLQDTAVASMPGTDLADDMQGNARKGTAGGAMKLRRLCLIQTQILSQIQTQSQRRMNICPLLSTVR